MRYRKPFTPEQRREAVAEYDSFRRHVIALRKRFPPRTAAQRSVFKRYQGHVHKLGTELLKVNSQVGPEKLNAQVDLAKVAIAEYYRARQFDR
jgi:hypothetical protein